MALASKGVNAHGRNEAVDLNPAVDDCDVFVWFDLPWRPGVIPVVFRPSLGVRNVALESGLNEILQ